MRKSSKKQRPDPRADIPDEYKPAEWLIKEPNRPPDTETAISHRDVLYSAIARVLTAWEVLETLLGAEFQTLMGTERISALQAWGSIVSNKARVQAIMAAADVELSGDVLTHHKRCMLDVQLLGGARNLVAHGMVYARDGDNWVSDDPRLQLPGPFILGPAPYNTTKFFNPKTHYRFSLGAVEAIGAEIQKMQTRVAALRGEPYRKFLRFSFQ